MADLFIGIVDAWDAERAEHLVRKAYANYLKTREFAAKIEIEELNGAGYVHTLYEDNSDDKDQSIFQ